VQAGLCCRRRYSPQNIPAWELGYREDTMPHSSISRRTLLKTTAFAAASVVSAPYVRHSYAAGIQTHGADFTQTNLVSDIKDLATITDPQLKNPWGVSHRDTSPFWVANQGTSTATLYAVTDKTIVSKVNINPPTGFVAIPPSSGPGLGPTGQVSNTNTSSFPVAHDDGTDGTSA